MLNKSSLQTEHLHFLKDGVQFIEEEEESLFDLGSQLKLESLQSICHDNFSWAYLYELPVKHQFILIFSFLGVLPVLVESIKSGVNPNQAIITQVNKIQQDPNSLIMNLFKIDKEPSSLDEILNLRTGPNGCFGLADLFALIKSSLFQVQALRKHGKSLSELIQDVKLGKDESFWLALHIDPTVLSCSVFSRRMSLASMQNDQKFFHLIGNALKVKWKKPKATLDPLRVILHACNEAGWLDNMTQDQSDKLFIQELQAYSNDGEDPARGLQKFIYRWKKTL